jgi:polyphosphate glucokinase
VRERVRRDTVAPSHRHGKEGAQMTDGPHTLAIDVGGSGLKAMVLSPDGEMQSERARRETPYPCTPPVLLDELAALADSQPPYDRVSVGYPGAIRRGIVRDVTAFVRPAPGEPKDPKLIKQWIGYDLQSALAERFGKPVRVANDADVQGCAVIEGRGMELVITLGTGVGCAVFFDGTLLPHMELSHGRFGDGLSIEVACGDNERHKVGKHVWRERVLDALETFEEMVLPDHIFIGGGNAKRLEPDTIGPNRTIVPNISGLLGGIALWERTEGAAISNVEEPLPSRT